MSPLRSCSFLALVVSLAALLPAQIQATYDTYGKGCPGTGVGIGNGHIVPGTYATVYASSNNVLGFSNATSKYQQVFSATEFPSAYTMTALGLRWDNQLTRAIDGATFDLELQVGYTTRTPTTLSTTFAANFDSGTPVTVLPRSLVKYPNIPYPVPLDPTNFQLVIPWTTTFAWVPTPGRNLLVQVTQRGNSSGFPWPYPLDAGYSPNTARLYATPDTATTGTLDGFTYGYVMSFFAWTSTAVPVLGSHDQPQIGNTCRIDLLQARASAPAFLLHGVSNFVWSSYPLPLDLGFLGAPLCSLLASADVVLPVTTTAAGKGAFTYSVPMNFAFVGVPFFNQFLVLDPGANPLGLAVTNGGAGVIGN